MNRLLAAVNTVASFVSAMTFMYFTDDLLKISEKTIGMYAGGFVLMVMAITFVVTIWINFFKIVLPEE